MVRTFYFGTVFRRLCPAGDSAVMARCKFTVLTNM